MNPIHILNRVIIVVCLILSFQIARAEDQGPQASLTTAPSLAFENKPMKIDFDQMFERRLIRMVVPYSRTLYFNDKGRARGITADLAREFELHLNKKFAKELGKRPLTVAIFPASRDKLISSVADGLSDIAAGNLTVTPERLTHVDFYAPDDLRPVQEIVVNRQSDQPLNQASDLAGKTVHVRPSSSYFTSLTALNDQFKTEGLAPINLVKVPDALEDEDMIEMVGAKMLENIVVDDWKGKTWGKVVPNVRVNEKCVVHDGGRTGWAYRKNSPKLEAELADFYKTWLKKKGIVEYLFADFAKKGNQIKDSRTAEHWKRFESLLAFFKKYGAEYNFDPLMLAAQGFQESQLNQDAKSHVGAIGIMQIMPATGKELKVGDIHVAENNVHGGSKYMSQLMTKYFRDAEFQGNNRTLFAFASYNAGPGRIAGLRKIATERGLDPNQWFNNVELIAAEKVGIETTTYVRNIFKYYVAYQLQQDALQKLEDAKKQVGTAQAG